MLSLDEYRLINNVTFSGELTKLNHSNSQRSFRSDQSFILVLVRCLSTERSLRQRNEISKAVGVAYSGLIDRSRLIAKADTQAAQCP